MEDWNMAGRSSASRARLLEFLLEHPVITVVRKDHDGDRHEPYPASSQYRVTWQRVAPDHHARVAGRGGVSIREAIADRSAARAAGEGGRP
jgi:hypothetical protein